MGAFRRTSGMHPFFYLNPMENVSLMKHAVSLKETKTLPLQGVYASFEVQVYIFCGASI